VNKTKIWCVTGFGVLGVFVLIPVGSRSRISELLIEKCVIGLYLLYTSQNLLGTIFRVTFAVLYRRIWSIVGNYFILCCDNLYERKELLRVEEEKSWKIQEAMMKYGKSGSSDEDGSDDETEEEEEEEYQVLLNRHPSKRQRQEEKPAQENVPLIPKVEKILDTSSKDRFEHICKVLGEMQAEHRMRGELLREAC
jgi:hypothetical protein